MFIRCWASVSLLAAILLTLLVPSVRTLYATQITHPRAHLTLVGKITATDSEAIECYWQFATGVNAMVLMTQPKSDLCTFFGAKVGSWVNISITPAEAPKP